MSESMSGTPDKPDQVVGRYRVIPIVQAGSMANADTAKATPAVQHEVGLPGALVADWHDRRVCRANTVAEQEGIIGSGSQISSKAVRRTQNARFKTYVQTNNKNTKQDHKVLIPPSSRLRRTAAETR